ncbi:unnamed protein product [Owenia fusiformis]|uniref:Biogenesis of lysosome-related organelles complex 1 subunit 6 n=1 Tax=Owenia fusiformis TaxID=6347 RepID=A0A8J1YAD0_OWEFU|nr:unnamed protein product [Owenia fusiformis]
MEVDTKEMHTQSKSNNAVTDSIETDKSVEENLTDGLLAHFLPECDKAKSTISELTENQRILIETILQENSKFSECHTISDLAKIMTQSKVYRAKLLHIKKEMVQLTEKSSKLKHKAIKIQQDKQKEALQKEQQKEKDLERERHLVAKTAKKPQQHNDVL